MLTKKKKPKTVFTTDPPVFLLKDLTVRVVQPEEYERAGELLDQEHYLGDLRTGRALLQAVEYQGHWVALLDWGSAGLKLADREQWIGWTAQQRAERLKLVAMNRAGSWCWAKRACPTSLRVLWPWLYAPCPSSGS